MSEDGPQFIPTEPSAWVLQRHQRCLKIHVTPRAPVRGHRRTHFYVRSDAAAFKPLVIDTHVILDRHL